MTDPGRTPRDKQFTHPYDIYDMFCTTPVCPTHGNNQFLHTMKVLEASSEPHKWTIRDYITSAIAIVLLSPALLIGYLFSDE